MEISTEINVENKENDTNYLNNGKNGAVFIEAEDKTVLFHTETTKIVDCETQLMTDNGTSNACKINILSNVVLHVDKVFESQESAVEEEPESSITTAINEPSHSIDNVDSDSDDDIIKRIKKSNIIDSDSESNGDGDREQVRRELFGNEPTEKNNDDELTKEVEEKSVRKRIANIIDSDSDEDLQVPPHNRSFNDEQPVFVANNRGELIPEKITNVNEQNNRLKALCDSESEEEYREDTQKEEEMTNIAKSVRRRNNKKQNTNEKPKMTAKIAAEQKREIFSERQRRVREADISLPYHRPKARTLQEFLEKRPRLASAMAISENVPASVAIKMSLRQLEVITKKLEEREKEVQEFYKSESEPEEEEASAKQEAGTNEGSVDEKEEKKSTNEEIDKTKETDPQTDLNNKEVDDTSNKNEHKIADEEINETSNIGTGEDLEKASTEKGEDVNEEMPTMGDCVQKNNIDNLEEKEESPNIVKSNEENSKLSTEAGFDETKESLNVIEEAAKKLDTSSEDTEKDKESKDFESDKSSEYEFNLDDLEEFDLEETKGDSKQDEKDANGLDDETTKIDKGENVENKSNQTKLLTKQELLAKLALTKPKLSGNPDEMINLQDGIKDRSVSKLMERFVKHACPINTNKINKMEVSVVRVTSGGILKEHVSMKMDEEEPPVATEKPGAKLQKLRNVLQEQMEQKRAEQWQQKKVEKDIEEENVEDEAILDDEEEEALTESSSEEEEEEEAIEDVKYVDKPRVKNDFVDDEAEETDVEEKEDEEDIAEDADDENEPESDDDDKMNETEAAVENNKKPLKRIAKAFEDSDDSENEFVAPKPVTLSDNIKKNSSVEIHSVSTETADDDDFPPPNQPNVLRTPLKEPTQSKDDFLLSPVTNLTGLQSFNLATQFLHESPKSPLLPVAEPSPLREPKWKDSLQKKLLFESSATNNSQVVNEEKEIEQICSGSFPKCDDQTSFSNVPTQDIINMCSGQFPSFTSGSLNENEQPKDGFSFKSTISETPEENPKENPQRTNVELIDTNTDGEIKNFDDGEENLISQLLNEEEMENFKKKLDLDSKNTPEDDRSDETVKKRQEDEVEEIKTGGLIVDSDEENLTLKKRCNKRKLVFSDEEDSDIENKMSENEEIDLHDGDNEEEIDLPESDERDENESEKIVEYDSEENEIEVGDVRADKEVLKPSDFFENEAELSESDWGSADEDEKDLDKLEQELGDEDQFDERKERANLERLHMRQMLDEDSYNIKLLQEIYLDDGELHGAGRQRQFRWRNIDNVDDKDGVRKIDDQEDGSDVEESEENWRRMRRECELFLKKQQSKQTDDSIDSLVTDSQILRLEKITVIKSQTNTPVEKAPVRTVAQMSLPNKRGSFLSRNDQVLNRLAEFTTKINGSNVAAPKNTKNFVFHTLNDNETSGLASEKKRKSQADGTPNAIKKLRLSNLSPATGKGNLSKSERAKKLFSNW